LRARARHKSERERERERGGEREGEREREREELCAARPRWPVSLVRSNKSDVRARVL
jgi:hypothetical protein